MARFPSRGRSGCCTVAWMEEDGDAGVLKGDDELFSDERANRILTAQERGLVPAPPPEESSSPG